MSRDTTPKAVVALSPEQLETFFAHFGVAFVGHQLDAVVERPDRRHQVVAQARTQQAGKVGRIHWAGHGRG